MDALLAPWREGIMLRALLEVVLIGLTAGTLGCWLVFYELAYGAESLAHALFPGLVVAALLGLPLLAGGAVGVVAAALAVALAARVPAVGRDTAVAVVVTGMLGLGVLLALAADSPPGLQGLLFGDVLGVATADLTLAAGLAAVVLLALRALHGRLLAVGLDRATARSLGVRPGLVDAALLVLLAATILVAVQGLGNLLVVAVLVAPAAAARPLARRMSAMMALACAAAILSGVAGLYLSYYAGTAAGASIVLAGVAVWLAATAGARVATGRAR
jgi:ABC-type Mn2+/Zn2+ transport system permease subunit